MEAQERYHKERMRSILESSFNDLLSSAISLDDFQLDTAENKEIDEANFQLVKDYYNSCNDIDINDGDDRLKAFFEEYQKLNLQVYYQARSEMPFTINRQIMDIISYPNSNDDIIIEVGGLYSIELSYDEEDRNKMSLFIYPPLDFENRDTAPLTDYTNKQLIELFASLFSPESFTERDIKRVNHMEALNIQTLSEKDIRSIVESAISVQNRLLSLSKDK